MGTVYIMHGVVDSPCPNSFLDRNMLDRESFTRFLEQRPAPFAALEQALAGGGDALTIDDSIYAGYDAALLARRHGHEVTFFVNPSNIETGLPYWFFLLNLALDRTRLRTFRFNRDHFMLDSLAEKRQLRWVVKRTVYQLADEDSRAAYIRGLMADLGVYQRDLPRSLRPLSAEDIARLVEAGVQVENHGWTHAHPVGVKANELWADVRRGRAWLRERIGVESRVFAVPFGDTAPPEEPPAGLFDTWLMADARFFAGPLGQRIVNRKPMVAGPPRNYGAEPLRRPAPAGAR
jgi:hypothetical protein